MFKPLAGIAASNGSLSGSLPLRLYNDDRILHGYKYYELKKTASFNVIAVTSKQTGNNKIFCRTADVWHWSNILKWWIDDTLNSVASNNLVGMTKN